MTPNDGRDGRTAALRRCLATAWTQAWQEDAPVDIHQLRDAVLFTDDRTCRARLVLRSLHFYSFVEDDVEVPAAIPAEPLDLAVTDQVAAVLARLDYWRSRTGDETADTVHLLLACLESIEAEPEEAAVLRQMGITLRDVVREAMVVRYQVSPADRQARERGPILSAARSGRPAAHTFAELPVKDRRRIKAFSMRRRSQLVGTAEFGSPMQLYLIRMHLCWDLAVGVLVVAHLTTIGYAMVAVTPWAGLWIAGSVWLSVPTWARVTVLVLLTALFVRLELPWWPAVGMTVIFGVMIALSRFGLLEVRADVADPAVSPGDLRRDGRINARGVGTLRAVRLMERLPSR